MDGLDWVLNKLEAFTAADFEGHNIERLKMQQSLVDSALRICLDIGLWHEWTATGGGEKHVTELVELTTTPCEPNLLRQFTGTLAEAMSSKLTFE